MTTEEDYVERLEKILDKQDELLSQFDAKFKQQDSLNEILAKKNNFLEENIQKHKNLTRDMNKTVIQHKNVVAKLKKELEDQLKIQQDLHREYGEIIKQLTDDLEEEQNKNEELIKEQEKLESEIKKLTDDLKEEQNKNEELIKKQEKLGSEIKKLTDDLKDEQDDSASAGTGQNINSNQKNNDKVCPNCGEEINEGYLFCEHCGTKL